MQLERHWTNAPDRHVRSLAHSFSRFIDQRDDLGRGERLITFTHDAVEIPQIVELFSRDGAVQLSSTALTYDYQIQRLTTARQGQVNTARERHHHEEDCDS